MLARRRDFLVGSDERSGVPDVVWLRSDGVELTGEDWKREDWRSLAVFLNGKGLDSTNPRGEPVVDDSFYILFNAHHEPIDFTTPGEDLGKRWLKVLDTFDPAAGEDSYGVRAQVPVRGLSLVVLRRAD